jgi:hypothetical protein
MADSKRFLLRLDPRLYEALRRWARDELRSVNGQIEYLLTEQARRAGRLPHQRTKPPRSDSAPPAAGDHGEDPEASFAPTSAPDHVTEA